MAIIETKRAAERHLSTLTPFVPCAWESVDFENLAGEMYQRVQFTIQPPEDPVIGVGFHREKIIMQVFVAGASNKGTGEVINRAELIRARFAKGLVLIENDIRIHVLRTPQIAGTMITSDRIVCPVLIELVVEVYSN